MMIDSATAIAGSSKDLGFGSMEHTGFNVGVADAADDCFTRVVVVSDARALLI